MKLIFTPIAQEHWEYWKKNDPNIPNALRNYSPIYWNILTLV